jgi:multiple sugar transport system permease protein
MTFGKYLAGGAWAASNSIPHVQDRVDIWLDPFNPRWVDEQGYQIAQSLFAQADGGLFGTGFGQALVNSLTVSVLATLLAIAVAIPFAYALDRFRFRAEGWLRQFLLVTQMLSPIVLVIGLFRLVVLLGLVDTASSLIWIYGAFNIAFTVWMLQSYFATIPKDLEEAAWSEGASAPSALWLVFLPLAVPAVTVASIFSFINAWNEFVIALTILRSQPSYTLPIQIFSLVAGRYTVEWHHVMAAAFVATIPVAIVFAWLQQYLVRGLSLGAVK